MPFVSTVCLDFSSITNIPINILSSINHTIVINSLVVCNTFNNDIKFNLNRIIHSNNTTTISNIYKIKNKILSLGSSLDIIEYLGNAIYLPVTVVTDSNILTASLLCYTSGVNQILDCSIDYTILYENGLT